MNFQIYVPHPVGRLFFFRFSPFNPLFLIPSLLFGNPITLLR